MYDLRILLIWFALGFLLYLITIKPEQARENGKQKSGRKPVAKIGFSSGLGWEPAGIDRDVVDRLREMSFVDAFDPVDYNPGNNAAKMIPRGLILSLGVIPLGLEGNILVLAMVDPFDLGAVDMIRDLTGREIRTVKIANRDFKSIVG